VGVRKVQARADEAAELLKKAVQHREANLDLAARLYEEIGKPADAEALLWRLVNQDATPPRRVELARFLGRQGHADEALDICEKVADAGQAFMAANNARQGIKACHSPPPEQFQRVERLLAQAQKQVPGSSVIALKLADVYELQEKFPEAEALYRQVLEGHPNDVAAANNLAWLLAFQKDRSEEALNLINRA